ncbi:hypothetical protein CEQ90_08735 [Lewinellaceae bacterium SD302]|nr:hypothetical protein CEQ90_08735 [Lewinellaceae bacterium SD302]
MRSLFTLSLMALLTCVSTLSAQDTDFYITRHGGELLSRSYLTGGAVPVDGNSFALFYHATREENDREALQVDLILPTGQPVGLVSVAEDFDLRAGGIVRPPSNKLWFTAQANRFGEDNFSDIFLYEYGSNGLENTYEFDNYRYEIINSEIVASGPNSISFLIDAGDSHLGADRIPRLMTVNTNTGELMSMIDLPTIINAREFVSLTKGQDGLVLVAAASRFNNQLIIADVEVGSIVVSDVEIPTTDCNLGSLYTINYLYDEENERFIQVNECLDVFAISNDGDVSVSLNISPSPTGTFGEPTYLREGPQTDQFYVHVGSSRFLLVPIGNDYDIADMVEMPFNADEIGSPFSEGRMIVNEIGTSLNGSSIYEEGTNETTVIEAYQQFSNRSIATISRSIGLGNNEILVAEEISFGEEANILFYSTEGELLDSINFDSDEDNSPRGFGTFPNGNYVTAILNRSGTPDMISVVSFSREEGLIDTLLTLEESLILRTLGLQATQGADGNFYISYIYFDEQFNPFRRVIGVGPDGTINFDVNFPAPQFEFSPEQPAVDENGSVYLLNETDNFGFIQLQRYDQNNELTYEVEIEHGYPVFIVSSAHLNEEGTKLLVSATGESNDGVRESFFYEIDTQDGSLLRTQALSENPVFGFTSLAIYQPGTSNILIIFGKFEGEEALVSERLSLTFSVYDENGLAYEEALVSGYSNYFLYDVAVSTDFFEVFASGYIVDQEKKSFETVLLGLDYDNVVSIEDVTDLAANVNLATFPNPTNTITTISWDQTETGPYELELISPQGRRISRWLGELTPGRTSLNLNLSQRSAGTYLLRLTTDGGVSVQKIVKQ